MPSSKDLEGKDILPLLLEEQEAIGYAVTVLGIPQFLTG